MRHKIRSTRTARSRCPNCRKRLDAATSVNGARPKPGDFSVCLGCGHLLVYADDMTVREPTEAELIEIAGNPQLLLAQKLVSGWRERKRAR